MNKIIAIAESLERLYDMEIIRLDIQYNMETHTYIGYLSLGDVLGDVIRHEFKINTDCTFWEVTE